MKTRKAPKAAARNRDPRNADQLASTIDTEHILENPALQSVYLGRECIGFLLSRGKLGIEAYDVAERSLGIFPTMKEAGGAVSKAAGGRL